MPTFYFVGGAILDHLRHFADIYERSEIVGVRDPTA